MLATTPSECGGPISWRGEPWLSRAGEAGRGGNGEADGNGECLTGDRVKRKIRASICQNVLLLINISFQPAGSLTLVSVPTHESSLATSPIRSNFCMRFLPLKMPSRLILILQSALGRPAAGVKEEASVVTCGFGGSL